MLLVPEFHLHSHILAVPSSPALLPLSWFIVIFHLDESLLAGFSTLSSPIYVQLLALRMRQEWAMVVCGEQ